MVVEAPYIPNACHTELTPDGKFVRVVFEQHGHPKRELLIPAMQFPSIAKVLQVQAEQLPGTHYKRSFLAPGQSIGVDAFRLTGAKGELTLTVSARIFGSDGEHGVTIPMPVSAEAAEELRVTLNQRLTTE